MYAIVEFTAAEEVEVVPCTWMNGETCLWPKVPSDRATRMVRRGTAPDASFQPYAAVVKGVFRTYEEGRAKLDEARFRSDLSGSDDGRKRKRAKPLRYSSESDSDDFPHAPLQLSTQHKTPSSQETQILPLETEAANEDVRPNGGSQSQQSQAVLVSFLTAILRLTLLIQCSIFPLTEFQRRVMTSLNILRHNQAEIIQLLSVALQRASSAQEEAMKTPEQVLRCPLESVQAVLEFNETLNEAKSEALVLDLIAYGTRTLNMTIKAMMAYLISDRAASQFSMDGRKGKVRFRDLKLCKVLFCKYTYLHLVESDSTKSDLKLKMLPFILVAARRTRHHKDCTVDDVVCQVKEWLRRAKERCAATEKKD
ncbi:uncharacterized protein LOC119442105 [Dermacentor silvarum]|uniref:uncharacterized protein LOC119442105 n=1 Tax=Dermacentor silvarum TaxID=543639 RepID=UPI002100D0CB|nr:uncharacterized protein LOC119442105 [Dermacentor silvarum]